MIKQRSINLSRKLHKYQRYMTHTFLIKYEKIRIRKKSTICNMFKT